MNIKQLVLATACALASSICFANIPGGGDGSGPNVTYRDMGDNIVLDNGIVTLTILKRDASIRNFTYKGMNLFAGGHGGGGNFWSWNAPAFGGPADTTTTATLTVDPGTNNGDYAEVKIRAPWSGNTSQAAMDTEIYYSLKRGAQGYYVTATLDHPASYPRTAIGEWRSNIYISPMFDWLSVDALRNRKMPTVADMAASVPVTGAPKEVTQLTTGEYAGQYEVKYSYSADLGDLNVWGWSSTSKKVGIWMTIPSHEYYNGGPMKRELTGHMNPVLLNMLTGTHYSMGTQLVMEAGKDFTKTYGPYFVYANSYQGAEDATTPEVAKALWQDAEAQALAERSAWPYTWFQNPKYVQAAGRGSVSGTLTVYDTGKPSATAAGAWIGLAPEDGGLDFQLQGRTYQFWVKTDADGRFTIPNVLPGVYNLLAFGAGNIGTFKQAQIDVQAGEARELGTVVWTPPRVAKTLFEIGIPDRDSKEYRNGAFNYSLWPTFPQSLAEQVNGFTYTVGKTDWRTEWNYAQFGQAPWNVDFSLTYKPAATATASLYIGFASANTTLEISLNGTRLLNNSAQLLDHAPLRQGSHGPFAERRLAIPVALLRQGKNTLTFKQIGGNSPSGTTQYDYLRVEADGMRLSTPQDADANGVIQAEAATLGGGTTAANDRAGYNGAGFLSFPANGGSAELNGINGGAGGTKTITVRYANGNPIPRAGVLKVNGVAQPIVFGITGGWTRWKTTTVNVSLAPGWDNTLRFESTGQSLGNIDEVIVP
ncbi:polysaccharide lyase family protein [Massilia varians]|uniref:polysaccharide lyase family protein n=1 Tax=Massilia varians TaxID=457921 RepID=UPI0025527649|nr:polysaccharide lyase family protein [Massilia varians]MDK6076045.1 polysaccharide lyase family protein [Massilia varians]